jgi:hypothetical protein
LRLEQGNASFQPAAGGEPHRVIRSEVDPSKHHVPAHIGLQVAVRKMQPVQISRKARIGRRDREPPVAIFCDDVVDVRARLGQHQIVVDDHGRSAERMQ